jgi:hypothetical protein
MKTVNFSEVPIGAMFINRDYVGSTVYRKTGENTATCDGKWHDRFVPYEPVDIEE